MGLRYRVASVPIPGLPGTHVLSSAGDEGAASLASSFSSSSAKDKVRAVGLLLAQHLRRVIYIFLPIGLCYKASFFYNTLHVNEGPCTFSNCWLLLCAWTKKATLHLALPRAPHVESPADLPPPLQVRPPAEAVSPTRALPPLPFLPAVRPALGVRGLL